MPLALGFTGGFHGEQETWQGKAPGRKGGRGKEGYGCAALSAAHWKQEKVTYIHGCSLLHRDGPNNLPTGERQVQKTTTGANNIGK